MKKPYQYTLGVFSLVICCLVGMYLYFLLTPVVQQENGYTYYLRPGSSKHLVITDLSQQGVIPHPYLFSLFAYTQLNGQLKSGEYLFRQGSTALSLWHQMTSGTGFVTHQFTIIPGWTFLQLRNELNKATALRHLTLNWDTKHIMSYYGRWCDFS